MFVRTSDEKGKKLCCQYCNKLYCKLARHVEMMHKDEADVQKFAALPKGNFHLANHMRLFQTGILYGLYIVVLLMSVLLPCFLTSFKYFTNTRGGHTIK